jgi:predicted secreted Zn-dependent protease
MRILLSLFLLLLPALSSAEVVQALEIKTYPVTYQADTSLRQAINSASPIRHNGKVFHGFTRWHVNWQFWWTVSPNGQCAIHHARTRVNGTITLPVLHGAPAAASQAFEAYVTALRQHEMGHYRFGLDAAHHIDHAIGSLPPQASCALLEVTANRVGRRILDEAIQAEAEYDRDTQHGRTQGAVLDR